MILEFFALWLILFVVNMVLIMPQIERFVDDYEGSREKFSKNYLFFHRDGMSGYKYKKRMLSQMAFFWPIISVRMFLHWLGIRTTKIKTTNDEIEVIKSYEGFYLRRRQTITTTKYFGLSKSIEIKYGYLDIHSIDSDNLDEVFFSPDNKKYYLTKEECLELKSNIIRRVTAKNSPQDEQVYESYSITNDSYFIGHEDDVMDLEEPYKKS